MAQYLNHYGCSECGHHWTDEWSCMCDDRCPDCNTPISPYFSKELEEEVEAETDEETEEEHAVRLRKISEEVIADMKAGRYRHGQLRPEISAKKPQPELLGFAFWEKRIMDLMMTESLGTMTGRFSRRTIPFHEMYSGTRTDMVILDEWSDISERMWLPLTPRNPRPGTHDWEHPIPTKGPETPPSDAKRQQLRAKRKRKR